MQTTTFTDARLVTPAGVVHGSLVAVGPRIADLGPGPSRAAAADVDCEGDWLIPGIVDIHTDNLERHFFPRPNIDWDPVSAAIVHDGLMVSVGVTTVFDSLAVGSLGVAESRKADSLSRLADALETAAGADMLKADHRLHWRCECPADVMADWLPPLAARPMTGLLSLMDHTPGQRQYRDARRFHDKWRAEGMTETAIAERIAIRRDLVERNDARNRRLVAEIARDAGVPLASHDDETAEHVDEAADLGAVVAEFPVTEAAAARARARGMAVVMGGPNLIRGGSYSGNVSASTLIEAKLLDGFASDYVPRSLIECAFALVSRHGWPIERAVDAVSGAPARATGLADRGALAPGLRADLVRVRVVDGRPLIRGVWAAGRRVG